MVEVLVTMRTQLHEPPRALLLGLAFRACPDVHRVPLQLAVVVATNSEPAGFACLSGALIPAGNSSWLSEYITGRLRGNHRNMGTINTSEE